MRLQDKKFNRQRGSSLLEALISLVVIGVATSSVTQFSRVAATEYRENTLQSLALYQVKNTIKNNNSESFFNETDEIALADVIKQNTDATQNVEADNGEFKLLSSTAIRNSKVGDKIVMGVNMPKSALITLSTRGKEITMGLDRLTTNDPQTPEKPETNEQDESSNE